jgi:tetratricopeptide (TPR) repeat protein
MTFESLVNELLLRWEEQPSLTAEELCQEYAGQAEQAALLEAVRRGMRELQAAAGFLAPTPEASDPAQITPRTNTSVADLPQAGDTLARTPAAPDVPGYEVLGELGRGGMGVVYKALQRAADRVVALKMILHGDHAGDDSLIRFRTEARAIARLQHPHIVQIYEVGEQAGLPYFSLEFCPGGSLAKKLSGTPLPPREAAGLVERLSRAVHAAHQEQIIHRDLKPANVLLAADGTPKITDFGLAKRLDAGAGPTQSNVIMGTPSYMAPEQACGDNKQVGPAVDVYALGAILYECLTGRPPFKAAMTWDTLQQVISEEPVSPRQLQSTTPRDLETICLKCLQKESGKRYASAAALAADCAAFLHGEPITARPAGRLERSWRWCKRKPVLASLVLTAGLFVVALVAGVVGTTLGLVEARRQRDVADKARDHAEQEAVTARAVTAFLQKDLLGQADIGNQPLPGGAAERNPGITVRELLDRAAKAIERKFAEQPETEAAIRLTLGETYYALGRFAEAQPHLERSVRLRADWLGADHPDTLTSKNSLAELYREQDQYDRAEPLYQEVLEGRTARLGADHPDTLTTKFNLAALYYKHGKFDRAEPLYQEVLEGRSARLGADHPDTRASKYNLALRYLSQGKLEQAEPLLREALEGFTARKGADHPDTLRSKNNLAGLYWHQGKLDRAEPLLKAVLDAQTTKLEADHPDIQISKYNLARVYQDQGKYDRAEPLFREASEAARKKLGITHDDTQRFVLGLISCYDSMKAPAKAEPLLRELADFLKQKFGADSPQYAGELAVLGFNLLRQQKFADAEPVLRDGLAIRAQKQPDAWTTCNTQSLLGGSLLGQQKNAEAEPLLLAGYEGLKQREAKIPANSKARLTEALERLVQLYDATGQQDKADEWRKQLEMTKAAKPPAQP